MRKFIFVAFAALLACAAAYEIELVTEDDWNNFLTDASIPPSDRSWIASNEAKKAVENFLKHMQCGWPDAGIPPLAPYTNPDLQVEIARSVVDAIFEFLKLRVDGLDKMQVKKLKVTITVKTVKFEFNFKEILTTAKTFSTDTFVDLLKQLGLSVRYEGEGPFEFALENLSISGSFKYKMPIMFGSIKIYKFQMAIGLGSVRCNIGGILGDGKANEFLNDQIEYLVPALVNNNQQIISDYIENVVIPQFNENMKGKKIWSLIFNGSGSGSGSCNPTPAPW